MQLHQLQPTPRPQKPKRIGRGGKKGWTSGRGSKGQRSRAGARLKPFVREIFKRYPKLRGYRVSTRPSSVLTVNLEKLEKFFQADETVNPAVLLKNGFVSFPGKKISPVKILGQGKLTKALIFEGCQFSKSAREKIEKADGVIKSQ